MNFDVFLLALALCHTETEVAGRAGITIGSQSNGIPQASVGSRLR